MCFGWIVELLNLCFIVLINMVVLYGFRKNFLVVFLIFIVNGWYNINNMKIFLFNIYIEIFIIL